MKAGQKEKFTAQITARVKMRSRSKVADHRPSLIPPNGPWYFIHRGGCAACRSTHNSAIELSAEKPAVALLPIIGLKAARLPLAPSSAHPFTG